MLHWHGDTFDLPEHATLLASSDLYPNQAFSIGKNILALQFHIEAAADSMEKWLIGHTCELRNAGISIPALRADNLRYAGRLEPQAQRIAEKFMRHLTH